MIECPWCLQRVTLHHDICPECKQEVLMRHLDSTIEQENERQNEQYDEIEQDLETMLANRFCCSKCKHEECDIQEIAMNGTGLSKVFDIEYHHYLFVSCLHCGFVEIYNPNILRG